MFTRGRIKCCVALGMQARLLEASKAGGQSQSKAKAREPGTGVARLVTLGKQGVCSAKLAEGSDTKH